MNSNLQLVHGALPALPAAAKMQTMWTHSSGQKDAV